MKRLSVLLAVGGIVGVASVEAAERPSLQRRRCATSTTLTSNGVLISCSGSAELITGVALTCTGTACAGSLYDSSSTDTNVANADVAFELAAAANGTTYIDLGDRPIRTSNGVTLLLDPNVRAMVVFTEQTTP